MKLESKGISLTITSKIPQVIYGEEIRSEDFRNDFAIRYFHSSHFQETLQKEKNCFLYKLGLCPSFLFPSFLFPQKKYSGLERRKKMG